MKLSITDRTLILNLLPKEGNIDTLKALRKFKESLSLSEAEKTQIHWRVEYKCPKCNTAVFLPNSAKCGTCEAWMDTTGAAQWDSACDPHKDIVISATIWGIITSALDKANSKDKLPDEYVELYDKFFLDK